MAYMTRQFRKLLLAATALGFAGAMTAGCTSPMSNGEFQAATVEQRFPITVEPQMATLSLRVDEGLQRLAAGEGDRIEAFAERWKTRGQGAITVSAPQGSINQRAGELAMKEAAALLAKAGVPKSVVSLTAYPASQLPNNPPVTVSFMTLVAVAPDCSSLGWPDNLGFNPRNETWSNFGCATQNNLAAMVSDPRDLVEPKASDPIDAPRRLKVIEKYRNGAATQTQRKSDESGQVSTVNASGGGGA
jgi:pilus assembly protein CpaD